MKKNEKTMSYLFKKYHVKIDRSNNLSNMYKSFFHNDYYNFTKKYIHELMRGIDKTSLDIEIKEELVKICGNVYNKIKMTKVKTDKMVELMEEYLGDPDFVFDLDTDNLGDYFSNQGKIFGVESMTSDIVKNLLESSINKTYHNEIIIMIDSVEATIMDIPYLFPDQLN